MIVYRVNVEVDRDVAQDWQQWMQEHHVPDVIRTGFFDSAEMFQVQQEKANATQRLAFVFEYRTSSIERFQQYTEQAAPELQRDHTQRYCGKFNASREILEHRASFA